MMRYFILSLVLTSLYISCREDISKATELPYNTIHNLCVGSGGTLNLVINSQEEFDAFYQEWHTDPLANWLESNYAALLDEVEKTTQGQQRISTTVLSGTITFITLLRLEEQKTARNLLLTFLARHS